MNQSKNYSKYGDAFNLMPLNHRTTAINSELVSRINDLEILKGRLKSNYIRELNYINDKIKVYESYFITIK